jgi:uncharacterized integral membrane protein (TIGR00697 family)
VIKTVIDAREVDRVYTSLTALFCVLIIFGNLVYKKFVSLDFWFGEFHLSVGVMLYPLTFLITDLITEFYGRNGSIVCIRLGTVISIFIALALYCMTKLEALPWSIIDDQAFDAVFGSYSVSFLGSVFACYISQSVDALIYSAIKRMTGEKYLWLRNCISTSVALLVDTTLVVLLLILFKVLPRDRFFEIILNAYGFKVVMTICCIPIFYLCVFKIKNILKIK